VAAGLPALDRARPINAYVIEHRDGLVLFDTGQDRASVTDPGYFPGSTTGVLYGRLARFEIGPQQTLTAGLDRLGYAAGDVTTAVLSHLHQDHIGGLADLSHADIIVSQAEWDTLSSPLPQMRGLMRRHIDLPGLRWQRIEPEPTGDPDLAPFQACHDLFGDGSLVLLPTPGHAPGSMSLLVRRPVLPPLMMVGDVTYDAHLLEIGHVPGVGSQRHLRQVTAMINTMRQQNPGLVILPADPGAASRLAQATGQALSLCLLPCDHSHAWGRTCVLCMMWPGVRRAGLRGLSGAAGAALDSKCGSTQQRLDWTDWTRQAGANARSNTEI
jgi:N-acyl homoserine lactone hydrolase